MGLFDSILSQVGGNPTVTNMAEKFGIDPDLAAKAVAALGFKSGVPLLESITGSITNCSRLHLAKRSV